MAVTASVSPWVSCPKADVSVRLRLFCFPYAGGAASIFHAWRDVLAPEIQVCPVQLPGRQHRLAEPPFTRLAPLVQELAQVLQPYLNVPFAFFGHSMGALLGFELARQLRREKLSAPLRLFVASCRAPQLRVPQQQLHLLSDAAFIEALRRLDGTPEELLRNAELMQLVLPTLRADFALCETYTYSDEAPLRCPISAFGGWQGREISRYELEAWRCQTSSAFNLQLFPGDHFFLHSARPLLLRAIAADLSRQRPRELE